MKISATIKNEYLANDIIVTTEGSQKKITIAGKADGYGSSVNGGEFLFLSLATCFCNDIYREAAKRKLTITSVEVTVTGEFGGEGEPASMINYAARVESPTLSDKEVAELISHVDKIAEVHNTLRKGIPVSLHTETA